MHCWHMPSVIVTDRDLACMNAIGKIFSISVISYADDIKGKIFLLNTRKFLTEKRGLTYSWLHEICWY